MSEEPLLPKSDKNHWDQLAESLGLAPSAKPQEQHRAESEHLEGCLQGSEKSQQAAESVAPPGENQIPEKKSAVPDKIPLQRGWMPKPRTSGNWDEIAGQLGLAPARPSVPVGTEASEREAPPAPASQEVAPKSRGAAAKGPSVLPVKEGDTTPMLAPIEQTIVPPALAEASLVAVATPEEEPHIIQEEVSPGGDWLEEQVVVPVEASDESADVWPLTHDILNIKDSNQAVAADTLSLSEPAPESPGGKSEGMAEAGAPERKGRKRHRRKKKSRPAPVNPEPFEEELPEIVELATVAEDNGVAPATPSPEEETRDGGRDVSSTSLEMDRKKTRRAGREVVREPRTEDSEEPLEGDEDADLARPSHKAIPGWAEVVGYVVQKNMDARARRPNHRDRRR